ncbi:MAG: DUF6686 family protein [Fluviicola sp.]
MCHYKTISNNSFGCLIQCKNCEQFHLGFGNIVLILSSEEFIRFTDQVHNIHIMHYEEEDAKLPKTEDSSDKDEKPKEKANKKIYMHTDSSKMVLAFTQHEWMNLYRLLEESRFMLSANELIDQS